MGVAFDPKTRTSGYAVVFGVDPEEVRQDVSRRFFFFV